MYKYRIKSPSGRNHNVWAETVYHAVQIVREGEGFVYATEEYFKLNRLVPG